VLAEFRSVNHFLAVYDLSLRKPRGDFQCPSNQLKNDLPTLDYEAHKRTALARAGSGKLAQKDDSRPLSVP